jgi:integrase
MDMARRRYQRGSVFLRGKKRQVWVGRWREDVVDGDGQVHRIRKNEVLGTRQDFPTQKLAMRELEARVSPVNQPSYRPARTENFAQFADWWKKNVLPSHRPSTQSSIRSQLRVALVPYFGSIPMKDIDYRIMQGYISSFKGAPKTCRNHVLVLQMMWHAAKAGGWVNHKPFEDLKLPKVKQGAQAFYSAEEARQIIAAAEGWFKTLYWVAAETGLRPGELAGLQIQNLDLAGHTIKVTHSVWGGKLQEPKTENAKRSISISEDLAAHLLSYLQTWKPNEMNLLFSSRNGLPIQPTAIRRYKLAPLCRHLGIPAKNMKAFRHGCATMMDQANVPSKVKQERLGHAVGSKVTMTHYTHSLPADHRAAAVAVGGMLAS